MKLRESWEDSKEKNNPFDNQEYLIEKEEQASYENAYNEAQNQKYIKEFNKKRSKKKSKKISGKLINKAKKKGPIAAIFGLVGGAGILISIIFAPGIALMQLSETLFRDLNSQLAGIDKTDSQLRKAKFVSGTKGCGAVKIACRFKTMNIDKATKMYKAQGINVEFESKSAFGNNRGRIKKLTYTNPQNNEKFTVRTPEEYENLRKSNIHFRIADTNARSPKFHAFKNTPAMKFLRKTKTSFAKKLTGNKPDELDKEMKKATDIKTPLSKPNLKPEKDKEGNKTGRYIDEDGKIYSADEVSKLNKTISTIEKTPKSTKLLAESSKGVMITGSADTACSVYNTSRAVSFAAKTARKAALIRFAMVFLNTESAMRASDATPEQIEFVSKKISEQDMRKTIPDESKMNKIKAGEPVPMIKNPNYRKSGLDSEFYKQSAYQDTPNITLSNQRLLVGGVMAGTLAAVNKTISKTLGAKNPRDLSKKCKVIQNPIIRGGSLVVGILAGVGSLGGTLLFTLGGSALLAFTLPYLISQLGEIVAGNVTDDLVGVDAVDAISIGTSGMMNGIAREQGMIPLPVDEMVEYQNSNRQTEIAYENMDRILATTEPFNIYNQFSFLGTISRSLLKTSIELKSMNSYSYLMAFSNILKSPFNLFSKPVYAATSMKIKPKRYQQCNDEVYKEMGVAADSSCSLLFGLPKEAVEADPVEVANWMAEHGEIDPNSEKGEAKDNGEKWNYTKFLKDCIEQEPGAHENIEDSPDNGYQCAAPENREKNWHYAKYTVSKNWNETLDGNLPGVNNGSENKNSSGEKGEVSEDGWAYPTTKDSKITSPFGMRNGSMHRGIDLAQSSDASGKPIFAARDGEVIAAGPAQGFGQWIVIKHDIDGKEYDTVYGHMYESGVLVKQGDKVKAGQEIGAIGNNGQSYGAHLHFEIWDGNRFNGGKAIDPQPIVEKIVNSGDSGGNE